MYNVTKKHFSPGTTSTILLVLGIVLVVVIVVVFVVIQINAKKTGGLPNASASPTAQPSPTPVYEVTQGAVKFNLISSVDMGPFLKSPNSYQSDLVTTERFIKVTVGAQNKGKTALPRDSWSVGSIVDSEGRVFAADNRAYYFVSRANDGCGDQLKPEFEPTPCTVYYEVSKISKGLKVYVTSMDANNKKMTATLDLNVK